MLKQKHYLYLNESEHSIIIKSLVQMKNKLTQQGRFTDCVDDLLMKVIAAPNVIILNYNSSTTQTVFPFSSVSYRPIEYS